MYAFLQGIQLPTFALRRTATEPQRLNFTKINSEVVSFDFLLGRVCPFRIRIYYFADPIIVS